jgi:magnesium transporter
MLPPHQRQEVWERVGVEKAGDVLWEASHGVAGDLIKSTERSRLVAICQAMDEDTLGQIADCFPEGVLEDIKTALEPKARAWLQTSITYPEDSVGRLMDPEMVVIQHTSTIKDTLKALRKLEAFPEPLDAVFVVDRRDRLVGQLPLKTLLLQNPRKPIVDFIETDGVAFSPTDEAKAAARAFERYDLVSAPVTDERGRLVGRLTVDAVMDFVLEEAQEQALKREGLSGEEDLFGPVWSGARRRWLWLSINLLTAFIASRVIGVFEESIERLVALATLMPIVASVGGNTGNQTVALVIRGLALDQINANNLRYLAIKELAVSALNGVIWGSVMGVITFALYQDLALGAVMAVAMLLNLLLAAAIGIGVPVAMHRLGRDPALGSSVLLTFTTDSMGFFIFLSLATAFLLS